VHPHLCRILIKIEGQGYVDWVFVGIMIGSIAYLALIVLTFVESYREGKAKIQQTTQDVERVDLQLKESEHARKEAEDRAQKLEEEALGYEQEITEIQYKIRAAMPDQEKS
jgi:lipid II:glycine glycyltransferase (peptidoglycan interpeptide bridge formation enzyme)